MWGALIGGAGTGLAFALLNERDQPCSGFCFSNSEAFTIGFVFCSVPGILIGAIIGQSRIHIRIGGSHDRYQKQKERIRSFLYDYP